MRNSGPVGWICLHLIWFARLSTKTDAGWTNSELTSANGHYPYRYCTLTHVVFNASDSNFYYQSKDRLHKQQDCGPIGDIWPLVNTANLGEVSCDETYDTGHVFTIFYIKGGISNYFHMHIDVLMPLHNAIWRTSEENDTGSQVLMPSVESRRLQRIDMDTQAFRDSSKYWTQMLQVIAKNHPIKPMNASLLEHGTNVCFRKLIFGTKSTSYTEKKTVRNLVSFVKSQLEIEELTAPAKPKIGIIQRKGRRLILNEKELVTSLQDLAETELIEFSGMSFRQQVQKVQEYTILVGMNGAGLTNAIYLPADRVAIQIVPYKAGVNFVEFGLMIKARGGLYLEWHNKHENLTRIHPDDTYRNNPDTIVHLAEFRELIKEALHLTDKAVAGHKEL